MKMKNILIVVKDIEKSRQFYHDLFGLDMVLDNDGNMILTEGLVLQDEKIWKSFLDRDIIPKSNSCELYFEEQDIESFVEKLERLYRIGKGKIGTSSEGEIYRNKAGGDRQCAGNYVSRIEVEQNKVE